MIVKPWAVIWARSFVLYVLAGDESPVGRRARPDQPSYPAFRRFVSVAARSFSGRPVMKNMATPLARAVLKRASVGAITSARALSSQLRTPHGPAGNDSQGPAAMKPKSLASISGQLDNEVSSISS